MDLEKLYEDFWECLKGDRVPYLKVYILSVVFNAKYTMNLSKNTSFGKKK